MLGWGCGAHKFSSNSKKKEELMGGLGENKASKIASAHKSFSDGRIEQDKKQTRVKIVDRE